MIKSAVLALIVTVVLMLQSALAWKDENSVDRFRVNGLSLLDTASEMSTKLGKRAVGSKFGSNLALKFPNGVLVIFDGRWARMISGTDLQVGDLRLSADGHLTENRMVSVLGSPDIRGGVADLYRSKSGIRLSVTISTRQSVRYVHGFSIAHDT